MKSLLKAALEYHSRGLSIFPCKMVTPEDIEAVRQRNGDKEAEKFTKDNAKVPLVKWQKYQQERATTEQVKEWFTNCDPERTAIAIVTGGFSGITVVDVDNKDLYPEIKKRGPGTPVAVQSGRGVHLYYSYTSNLKTTTNHQGINGIDIRNDGAYIIAPPSPHYLRKKYQFIKSDFSSHTLSPPPEWLFEPSSAENSKPPNEVHLVSRENTVTIDQIQQALQFIPADDYDVWTNVGMALKHEFVGDGLEIWREWSSKSEKYDSKEIDEKWDSFDSDHPNPVTAGTIFHLAKGRGWRVPKQNENLTDVGNGQRLVRLFGEDIRFVPESKGWFRYVNGLWHPDTDGHIERLAKETTSIMIQEGRQIQDEGQRQNQIKYALSSESNTRLKAMIEMASSEKKVVLPKNHLDRNPDILGLKKGHALNLRTGVASPGRRDDYISKHCGVDSLPIGDDCLCPTWEAFLSKIMDGNNGLIRYIQRAVGYSLTGHTTEQCLFFLYGTGSNGKTTFLNVLQSLTGKYSMVVDSETLMSKRHSGDGPKPEIARLKGARVLITSEVEEGKSLAENRIKQMTGGDMIVTRGLHQNPFEFKPEFKIWMAGNHKPYIKDTTHSIWRRIHLIPFSVIIPKEEQDSLLDKKLQAELPGILSWAIEGCKEWRKQGLKPTREVVAAVAEYRDEMDIMGHWIEEKCHQDNALKTDSQTLYQNYKMWCDLNGHYPLSQTKFGRALGERGYKKVKSGIISWVGIGIRHKQLASVG